MGTVGPIGRVPIGGRFFIGELDYGVGSDFHRGRFALISDARFPSVLELVWSAPNRRGWRCRVFEQSAHHP